MERGLERILVGPYRGFRSADNDARAWNGLKGWAVSVLPLTKIENAYVELMK
jgi:hypothetical protein